MSAARCAAADAAAADAAAADADEEAEYCQDQNYYLSLERRQEHVAQVRELVAALASSWRARGEISKSRAELRGAGFWMVMGSYGHIKSSYTFWGRGHLGPFFQFWQIWPELPRSRGKRYAL